MCNGKSNSNEGFEAGPGPVNKIETLEILKIQASNEHAYLISGITVEVDVPPASTAHCSLKHDTHKTTYLNYNHNIILGLAPDFFFFYNNLSPLSRKKLREKKRKKEKRNTFIFACFLHKRLS